MWWWGKDTFFLNSKKSTLAFVGFYNSETAEMLKLSSWQDWNWNLQSPFNLTRVGALHLRGIWWSLWAWAINTMGGHPLTGGPFLASLPAFCRPHLLGLCPLSPPRLSHCPQSGWEHSIWLRIRVVKSDHLGLQYWFHDLQILGPYSSYLILLCLGFLICKMGTISISWHNSKWVMSWKCIRAVPSTWETFNNAGYYLLVETMQP